MRTLVLSHLLVSFDTTNRPFAVALARCWGGGSRVDGHGSPGQAPAVHRPGVPERAGGVKRWPCTAGAGLVPWARSHREGRMPGTPTATVGLCHRGTGA